MKRLPIRLLRFLVLATFSDKHLASPRTTVRRSTPRYLCHQRQLFDPREPQSRSPAEQGSRIADTRKLGKCPDLGFPGAQCDGLSGGAGVTTFTRSIFVAWANLYQGQPDPRTIF